MNESIRGQAAELKLHAQDIASRNSREKNETKEFIKTTAQLSTSLKFHDSKFTTPRF
jgi:hypothetical protein